MCNLSFNNSSPKLTSFSVFIRFYGHFPFHHKVIMQAPSNAESNIDFEIGTESDIEDDEEIEEFLAAGTAAFAAVHATSKKRRQGYQGGRPKKSSTLDVLSIL